MVNRDIMGSRGDPNPVPIDNFNSAENSKESSFRRTFMKKEAYSEHRESKGAKARDHIIAASGEFVGTVLFLYFAFAWQLVASGQQVNKTAQAGGPPAEQIMYIAVGYGFSLLVCAWAFYRISGGLFNPAVVLGMCLAGQLPWMRGLYLFIAEMLGCLVAAALVDCMFPVDIAKVNTTLGGGTSIAQGVFIEMFLTCILIFTILMLAAEKSKVTFMAPLGIGLSLFVAELAGVFYTGGSLNPARSFGPAAVSHTFPGYHWIYWVGPFLGSGLTAAYFRFVKYFNYEEANSGQDDSGGDFKN